MQGSHRSITGLVLGGSALLWAAGGVAAEEPAPSASDAHCLALAAFWEAKNEDRTGKQAVAAVVMNRVEHPEFPDTVCEVVRDGGETPPCQFSWWCDGRSDQPDNPEEWREAREVASDVLNRRASDPTSDALYFHADEVNPDWRDELEFTAEIGGHLFYR